MFDVVQLTRGMGMSRTWQVQLATTEGGAGGPVGWKRTRPKEGR